MKLRLGDRELNSNIILAPMAGVTDLPFRLLCHEQGAGMAVTEMVSAKAILYKNKNTKELMAVDPAEGPVAVQLFGSDPEIMAEIAAQIEDGPFAAIDVNMGCPVPKIVNNGEGSALMKDIKLAEKILTSMVKAVKKPVTVKFRKGFNDQCLNAVEFAKMAESSGAAWVAVHGRTREQYYSGTADWEVIRQVKEAVKIPVIGNGDIFHAQDAARMMQETGCDGVMVARGAKGNPWIFHQILPSLSRYSRNAVHPVTTSLYVSSNAPEYQGSRQSAVEPANSSSFLILSPLRCPVMRSIFLIFMESMPMR